MRKAPALALISPLLLVSVAAQAKTRVVATLPTLAALAKSVGGELVEVEALAAPTEDPHFVDPRPNLILKLRSADLLVVNGLELERGWLPALQRAARNSAILTGARGYLDASSFVTKREVPDQKVDRSMGDVHPGGNPHFCLDPRQGALVATALGAKLGEVDPNNAAAYAQAAQRVAAELSTFAEGQTRVFAELPADKRKVIPYHRSFPYLFGWLGLEEVLPVEPRPGVAPDPGHVAKVLAAMRAQGVRVILQEEYQPSRTSSTLAELGHGEVVSVPAGPRLANAESYLDYLKTVTDKLHAALTR